MISLPESNGWGVNDSQPMPFQIIPIEYQGYVFLVFMVIAFILIGYMFYIIVTDSNLVKE